MRKKLLTGVLVVSGFGIAVVIAANAFPDETWAAMQFLRRTSTAGLRETLAEASRRSIDERTRYATAEGNRLTLYPNATSFRVPDEWIDWYQEFHNNFHLTESQLAGVEQGAGEWDTEYAAVVNAALPFHDCAAHVGGEGWGRDGVSFGDVQMRAYLTTLSPQEVLQRLSDAGLSKAHEVGRDAGFLDAGAEGRWRKAELHYSLWYGDYGGTATIRAYMTPDHGNTLVLVFMSVAGSSEGGEIQRIVDSVLIKSP
jgi:hypothetical protein